MVNVPKKVARLVIHTQFRENYGAHAWDGKGECPQHWKYKGGSTYVFDHLDNPFVKPKDYIDEITKLVEFRDDGAGTFLSRLHKAFAGLSHILREAFVRHFELKVFNITFNSLQFFGDLGF